MSIYCTIAVHIAPIAKPISANLEPFTLNFDINIVKIILIINAPAKEPNGNMNKGADGNNMIIVTADKLAPLVIPITSGEASAFLTTPCINAPEMARLLPTINAKNILGALYSLIIKLFCVKGYLLLQTD